jgi:DNA-binding SARP family transcriptional activator
MELRFYLFHELQIVHEGHTEPALSYRVQNLLALLLLRPQLRRREQIIDVLFPDAPLSLGRKRLPCASVFCGLALKALWDFA